MPPPSRSWSFRHEAAPRPGRRPSPTAALVTFEKGGGIATESHTPAVRRDGRATITQEDRIGSATTQLRITGPALEDADPDLRALIERLDAVAPQ